VDYLATHSYSGCVDCDVGYLWDLYNRYSRIFSRIDLKRNSFMKFIYILLEGASSIHIKIA
jgi:hypothetical protein